MERILLAISDLFNELTMVILMGGLFAFSTHVLLINKRTRLLRRDNKALKIKQEESIRVLQQRNLLQSRTKSIEDSLKYAHRIQTAVFTTPKQLQKLFPDSFIYQKPKEIVSGDFYWARRAKGKIIFSVADCTGHGVPGAFMSLIGIEFFRQIVLGKGIVEPASILNEMNFHFDQVFGSLDELALKDGIDLGCCAYDPKTQILEYAGAFNPLYLVRDGEILETKADKISIGRSALKTEAVFQNHRIEVKSGDTVYLFSDGYADQFGGELMKKFKYRNLKDLILKIQPESMLQQRIILDLTIEKWRGDIEQLDDILVIGRRF